MKPRLGADGCDDQSIKASQSVNRWIIGIRSINSLLTVCVWLYGLFLPVPV
jgi:hypothetical protein